MKNANIPSPAHSTTLQTTEIRPIIQSYGAGAFVVSGQRFEFSVLLTTEQVQPWKNAALSVEAIEALLPQCNGVEILLIGSGKTQIFISPAQIRAWRQQYHIAVEVMDTGAACRTFNVLQAEDRQVAAALMVI